MTAAVLGDTNAPPLERWVERRICVIWGLLFFNGMPAIGTGLVPIPHILLQLIPAAALGLAAVLALNLNRRMVVRPNLVLGLSTLLLAMAVMTSIRGTAGVGGIIRCLRLTEFLATLWLLTPWWGRRDLLLLRCHLRALLVVLASVVLGIFVAPSRALIGGRLVGILWPIPAPQVAQYAAVATGCAIALWFSGAMARKYAFPVALLGVGVIGLSHTRTAILALAAGIFLAAISLVLARRRVRRVLATVLLVAPLTLLVAAPALSLWFQRGQNSSEISALTGRKAVWASVLNQPRSEFNRWFGFGLSNKSSVGRPIDDTWLAVYRDEGIAGDIIIGSILLFLLIAPNFRPPGPARSVALFLVAYCAVASYTEVTIGDASPYLLHLVVAASLLIPAIPATPSGDIPAVLGAEGQW